MSASTLPPPLPPYVAAASSFQSAAGLDFRHRRYGWLEQKGIVVNFAANRFLKRIDNAVAKASFTRQAFYVAVDKEAYAGPRNRAIIGALPDGKDTFLRVKYIKYGPHNAMWEVLSGHLYALTGLTAPDSRLFIEKDPTLKVAYAAGSGDSVPDVLVASPRITGYYDLGDLLINNAALHFIDKANHEQWHILKGRIEAINHGAVERPLKDDEKMARIRLMEEIYKMLPDYFHREIEKAFVASKFVFNWDFANFDLNNIGVTFTLDREFRVSKFKSVFVDFGNSGVIGFGGKYKKESLERANKAAKPFVDHEHEYDPPIELSRKEMRVILEGMGVSTLNHEGEIFGEAELRELMQKAEREEPETLRECINFFATNPGSPLDKEEKKGLLFKLAHHISSGEAEMKTTPATGLLSVSDLPRNLPFAFLLRGALKDKMALASSVAHARGEPDFYRDSEIEMAYRLSLIRDEAIGAVVNKWYLSEDFADVFSVPVGIDAKDFTRAKIVEIFKDRRDELVSLIPKEVIAKWREENFAAALTAESEVQLAIAKETRDLNPHFDSLPYVPPTLWSDPKTAATIQGEIVLKLNELVQESAVTKEKIEALREAHMACSGVPLAQEAIRAQIDDLEVSAECKPLASVLEFIESQLMDWKQSFRPKLDPSCDFLNLHRYRDLYRATHHVDESATLSVTSGAENMERNRQIHEENLFVFDNFMQSLRSALEVEQSPATATAACAAASLTPVFQRPRAQTI